MITDAQRLSLLSLSLRTGLALVFAYAGIDAFREPNVWVAFLPAFAFHLAPAKLVLDTFSLSQLVLAAALLWSRSSFVGAAVSAIILAGIMINTILTDPGTILIVFRDMGLIGASFGLMLVELPRSFRHK